jgi:hypothetical protein
MAGSMGQHAEGSHVPIFLSSARAETEKKIPITLEFTAIITEHGKTKSYLYRFKLADNPTCPCNEGQQTPEHLIYKCKYLEVQRSSLIKYITTRGGDWSPTNDELVNTYLYAFTRFITSTDFQKLQQTMIRKLLQPLC